MCIYLEKGGQGVGRGCELFGKTRQAYYKSLSSTRKKRSKAVEVIDLVDNVRRDMPRIGTRKLYYLLENELINRCIGRDKFFRILRANHRLIVPQRSYKTTTNSHHRF